MITYSNIITATVNYKYKDKIYYALEKKLESSSLSDVPVLIHDLIIGKYQTILDILIENKAIGLL